MPLTLPALFRGLILAALALHVFYMYSVARIMISGDAIGFSIGTSTLAAAFGVVMLIPLVWAAWIPEVPEIYTRHVRARRWFNHGRCPACGYSVTASHSERCTECGSQLDPPEPYTIRPHTIRLFIAINLLAWVIGSAVGESWAIADERAFAREAAAHHEQGRIEPYSRHRWWPGSAVVMSE